MRFEDWEQAEHFFLKYTHADILPSVRSMSFFLRLRLPSSLSSSRFFSTSSPRPLNFAHPAPALPNTLPTPPSSYTLPGNVARFVGKVVSVGKMKNTISVSVERRLTDHRTLKVRG